MEPTQSNRISIPHPCNRNWDEMNPVSGGRFCSRCQTKVIDFTTWSDADLLRFFSENKGHICGRYRASQVDRPINIPYQPHSRLYHMAIALGLSLIFYPGPGAVAQTKTPKTEQTSGLKRATADGILTGLVSGTIVDEQKEPAVNAVVQAYRDGKLRGGSVTDFDGKFKVSTLEPGNYNLLILLEGYDSVQQQIWVQPDSNNTKTIQLKRRTEPLIETHFMGYRVPLINLTPQEDPKPVKPATNK